MSCTFVSIYIASIGNFDLAVTFKDYPRLGDEVVYAYSDDVQHS